MRIKRSSIFMKIVILALIVYAVAALSDVRTKIAEAEQERAVLQARVDTRLQENAELEYDIAHAEDPEVIEAFARAKLGLAKPGEKIFYDAGK